MMSWFDLGHEESYINRKYNAAYGKTLLKQINYDQNRRSKREDYQGRFFFQLDIAGDNCREEVQLVRSELPAVRHQRYQGKGSTTSVQLVTWVNHSGQPLHAQG